MTDDDRILMELRHIGQAMLRYRDSMSEEIADKKRYRVVTDAITASAKEWHNVCKEFAATKSLQWPPRR